MEYKLKIQDLKDKLNDIFKQDWLQEEDVIQSLYIEQASVAITEFFILTLLSGSYFQYLKDEDLLNELEKFLKEKTNEIEGIKGDDLKHELQDSFQRQIYIPFIHVIRPFFNYFLRDLKNQLDSDDQQYTFRGYRVKEQSFRKPERISVFLFAFKQIMRVTRIEHFYYHYSLEIIEKLRVISQEIKSLEALSESLKKAIIYKIDFLLKKLLYRKELKEKAGEQEYSPEIIFAFNEGEDEVLNRRGLILPTVFESWENLIKIHYGLINELKSNRRKRIKEIRSKSTKDYKAIDYHGLVKIYKDEQKDLTRTKKLLEQFRSKYNLSYKQNSLTYYSQICNDAYIFNNLISLRVENASNVEEFELILEDIHYQQNDKEIRNFFPWLKLANRINLKLKKLSKELESKANFVAFTELKNLLDIVLHQLNIAFIWSNSKKLIPFQQDFKDCQSSYVIKNKYDRDLKLFFFSSFVLPLDYKAVRKQKHQLEEDLKSYQSLSTVYKGVQSVFEEVNTVWKEVRKQERKSIEILAIFSAVALFSMGSIQILSEEEISKDPNLVFKFVFSFGYSLALFVLLIWLITRENIKEINKLHWVVISLFFLMGFFVILFVMNVEWVFFNNIISILKMLKE